MPSTVIKGEAVVSSMLAQRALRESSRHGVIVRRVVAPIRAGRTAAVREDQVSAVSITKGGRCLVEPSTRFTTNAKVEFISRNVTLGVRRTLMFGEVSANLVHSESAEDEGHGSNHEPFHDGQVANESNHL